MTRMAAGAWALAAIAATPVQASELALPVGIARPSEGWGDVYLAEIVLPRGYPHPTEYYCPPLDADTGQASEADSICIGGSIIYRDGRVRKLLAQDAKQPLAVGNIRVKDIGGHAVRWVGGGRFVALLERTGSGYFWVPYKVELKRGRACLSKAFIRNFAIRFARPPVSEDEQTECHGFE